MSTPTTTKYTPPPLPTPFNNTNPPPTLLTQGAEARLYKTTHLTPSTPAALKVRPSKPYRHPILDRRLTRQRILQEARCLAKLVREGVPVPALLALDWEGQGAGNAHGGESGIGSAWLLMEWVDGLVVRVVLERWEKLVRGAGGIVASGEEERVRDLMRRIGVSVGALHRAGVVHGDLTTSNLMLRPEGPPKGEEEEEEDGQVDMDGQVVLIDFGLAAQSAQDEDRAVDLYVLERAFGSTHPHTEQFFEEVLKGYRESFKGAATALKRLEDVRLRGRKRSMIG
ncbi:serine/threonine protein kinase BUD32 [Aspergillus candidus]|uniref:EKC/KEOPS complex subunit BUD32 n=1 Tax=Aspergillus candidus TaxID=41067 RepID=A0A2I2F2H1_ASPCN|nr:kinase-like domain-containing protein [Aspergillus candidus]PLB34796.1 kinase-like domain-containing protein [Aspergillus candidus]